MCGAPAALGNVCYEATSQLFGDDRLAVIVALRKLHHLTCTPSGESTVRALLEGPAEVLKARLALLRDPGDGNIGEPAAPRRDRGSSCLAHCMAAVLEARLTASTTVAADAHAFALTLIAYALHQIS